MSNNAKALKSGIWYTTSNFLVRSIGFITTPIFTRMLTKADFGLYNNFSSWLLIATVFVTLHLESTLISARYDYEDSFDEYIFSILGLSSLVACFWFAVVNAFSNFFSSWWNLDIKYINIMLLYLLFQPAVELFQNRERYFFEYKKTVITSLIISLGTSLLSVLLVVFLDNKLTGRIVGSAAPTIVLGVVFYIFFLRKGKRIKIKYWKYALPICLPYIPHLLSLNILNAMDKTMITRWCGAEENAMYSLAYTCGSIVTLLASSLNSAYAPWLGEKLAQNDENSFSEIRRFSKIYIACFLLLAIGIMALTPEVLLILGGDKYIEAKYVLAPISMGCVCQFLYTMLVNVEQFKKKTIGMAFASAIAALVNYVLNLIFIPRIGYLAAAYTTLVGYLCLLIIHMYLVKKMKYSHVYSYKYILTVVGAGIIMMVLLTILYSKNFIRYISIALYFCFVAYIVHKNKDKVLKILSIMKK